jgi:hypothetical protein
MNQIIIDLYEQASEIASADEFATRSYRDRVLETFAELIVKECIDCAVWVGKNNHNPVEPIHTAHAVKQRIEKHFGVE